MTTEALTRESIESELGQAMRLISDEVTRAVSETFEQCEAAGRAAALKEISFTVNNLKANLSNPNLSDADFRKYVRTIVSRLEDQGARPAAIHAVA